MDIPRPPIFIHSFVTAIAHWCAYSGMFNTLTSLCHLRRFSHLLLPTMSILRLHNLDAGVLATSRRGDIMSASLVRDICCTVLDAGLPLCFQLLSSFLFAPHLPLCTKHPRGVEGIAVTSTRWVRLAIFDAPLSFRIRLPSNILLVLHLPVNLSRLKVALPSASVLLVMHRDVVPSRPYSANRRDSGP